MKTAYVIPPQPQKTAIGPKGSTFYVKYHPEAPKWFRTDVVSTVLDPEALFGQMSKFALSQLTPGYLHPLVDAHRAAIELRKYPKLYDALLYRIADQIGINPMEVTWGRTNIEGRRRDAFHSYLDLISKRSVGSQ